MYPLLMAKMKVSSPAQDRREDQELLDHGAGADAREGIRQGLEDARNGRIRSAREFFNEFEATYRPFRESMRVPHSCAFCAQGWDSVCESALDVNPERLVYNLLQQHTANTPPTFIFSKIQ
ncbi:MAG: hypothetical protein WAN76_09465 [Candidatus Sulfotelmatobacter sp.]